MRNTWTRRTRLRSWSFGGQALRSWSFGRQARLALLVSGLVLIAERSAVAQAVSTPQPPRGERMTRRVIVSLADRKLALVENDTVVRVFPVAVGAAKTPTPVGTFTIVNRVANPTYYGRRKTIAPGPSNPLGTRWLGLDRKSYGIHGTDDPRSIGHARSHGCVRMHNRDVEQLFELLRPGDVVELRAEPTAGICDLRRTRQPNHQSPIANYKSQITN